MVKGLDNILSVRVDFNFADPCYVLQLATAQHGGADATVAAALSNNVIKVYNHHVADLQQISSLEGHSDRITDVNVPLQQAPSNVLSSSDDGTVRLWDCRSATDVEKYVSCILGTTVPFYLVAFSYKYVSTVLWTLQPAHCPNSLCLQVHMCR